MSRKTIKSDVDLSNLPEDAVIRLPDVLRLYPVSKSTWWEGVRVGKYPKPISLGLRARGWRLGAVLDLTRNQVEE
ncbi:MAG TPA: AlpA family phage regulatory protein [Rhodospirillales bacterium]|jgi:predicted DNA-binding transcriptional regulator AlpA|nr:AlpA family phage regulatory protein [Rhodospirillales bacterium]